MDPRLLPAFLILDSRREHICFSRYLFKRLLVDVFIYHTWIFPLVAALGSKHLFCSFRISSRRNRNERKQCF